MECREVEKFIHAYLDGEFDEGEWAAIRAHLDRCQPCQRRAQFEERFREVLKSSLQPTQAPAGLRLKVVHALQGSEREPGARRRWALRLVPAAAAAAVVGGLLAVQLGRRDRRDQISIVEQSIDWHRRHLPLDVTGSSPDVIQRYFSDKVPFAVRPPVFRGEKAQLVGARLTNLREHQAVYVAYQVNGRRVSVFIFDPDAVPVGGPQLQAGARRVRWQGRQGYNTLTYTSGGTGYAVTSDMDPSGLVQLVSHAP